MAGLSPAPVATWKTTKLLLELALVCRRPSSLQQQERPPFRQYQQMQRVNQQKVLEVWRHQHSKAPRPYVTSCTWKPGQGAAPTQLNQRRLLLQR